MENNKNSSSKNDSLSKIRSKYIIMKILDNLQHDILLRIINYNKKLQKIMSIKRNDYEKEFLKIEIQLYPKENNKGNFINIKNNKYCHIYFNNKASEEKRN